MQKIVKHSKVEGQSTKTSEVLSMTQDCLFSEQVYSTWKTHAISSIYIKATSKKNVVSVIETSLFHIMAFIFIVINGQKSNNSNL